MGEIIAGGVIIMVVSFYYTLVHYRLKQLNEKIESLEFSKDLLIKGVNRLEDANRKEDRKKKIEIMAELITKSDWTKEEVQKYLDENIFRG